MAIHMDARSPAPVGDSVGRTGPATGMDGQISDRNHHPIVISTRPWAGAVYVIAVNAGDGATDATISVPALSGCALAVLGEGRHIDSNGGSFTDHFDPLAVHIYVATPGS
jgi:hypothetical protein